ncbi:hypothetical protein GOC60_04840 [Sinorhizobium meliloti]|nr:hypothetical protein [Sinorhizobium meliloti]MDX0347768.1 hypothetical protein [Sinorhizobium meliloti]
MNLSMLGRLAVGYANRLDLIVVTALSGVVHSAASVALPKQGGPTCPTFTLGGHDIEVIPNGYETVGSYFERTNPEAYDLLYDPGEDLREDEEWVAGEAKKRGLPVVSVGSSRAYPVDLLRMRLG